MKEARIAMGQLLKVYPDFSNKLEFQANLENFSAPYKAVLDEGLRKAGLFDLKVGRDPQ